MAAFISAKKYIQMRFKTTITTMPTFTIQPPGGVYAPYLEHYE